ncbi:YybH family protein [Legionella brunensis]|uniref:DUF4440 domain-containing protein n=1 Tax=Legionella brunensis TaxID=29422 RepID=A0A0W0STB6_9GAMM|nr:nuclear transport factor 2 family protein [Legionella brunensis]KTC86445.1 hypothetical protein Lbru_0386 [Legionella brunensis]
MRLARSLLGSMILLIGAAYAERSNQQQTEIRNALSEWTTDFNTRNTQNICNLFSPNLRYNYRGFPEQNYKNICKQLRRSLNNKKKRYHYSFNIREILLANDLAVVRLVWTLKVTDVSGQSKTSREEGIDIFKKNPDKKWQIIRFLGYEEP